MLQGLLNLDGGVLLWIQEWVRSGLLTPLVTVYTHLGDSGVLWIALSVLLLCFKNDPEGRGGEPAGPAAEPDFHQRHPQAPGGPNPALADGGGLVP